MEHTEYEEMKKSLCAEGRYEDLLALCMDAYDGSDESEIDVAEALMLCRPSSPDLQKRLTRIAEKDNAYALYLLGTCLEYGFGSAPDPDEAERCYRRSADLGYTPAVIRAALFCETHTDSMQPNYEEAFELYTKAALAGDKTAQYRLAMYYEHGNGTEYNPAEAFRLCKLASDAGNNRATYTLGRYYETGFGTEVSVPDAIKCYEQAAIAKNLPAQAALHRLNPDYTPSKPALAYEEEYKKYYDALCEAYTEAVVTHANDYGKSDDPQSLLICAKMAFALKSFCGYAGELAFEWFSKAAAQGEAEALWYLSFFYMSGIYVVRNPEKSYELIKKAANMNYVPAFFGLAFFYDSGICVDKDSALAVQCIETAAKAGYTPACALMAIYYETGTHFERDEKMAEHYYAMVREKRTVLEPWAEIDKCYLVINPSDTLLHYRIYRYEEIRSGDSSKYFGAYGRIADQGCVYAMMRLAQMYEEGTSKSMKRLDRAFYYYKLAADAGYEPAQREFARFCAENPTVEAKYYASSDTEDASPEKAFVIYRTAAEAGDAEAMLHIARCYYEGTGTERDEDMAYRMAAFAHHRGQYTGTDFGRHIIKYADDADETALYDYYRGIEQTPAVLFSEAICLETGLTVDKNETEAVALLRKAADEDYRWAHFELGRCLEQGRGADADIHEAAEYYIISLIERDPIAIKYFTKFCEDYIALQEQNGDDPALMCLTAVFAEQGIGTEQDAARAYAQYFLAAQKGYAPALYFVGRCSESGVGTEKNTEVAFSFYKKAADSGFIPALCAVGRMYEAANNRINAVLAYTEAANKHSTCGYYHIGRFSLASKPESALSYLLRSADCENPDALMLLGTYYEEQGDMPSAIAWFEKAGAAGNTDAEVHLGMYYFKSDDVEDKKKAFDLFAHASRKGNAHGMLRAAECIARGIGTQKNPPSAVKYYTRSADAGNMYAQYSLGSCYERGFGVETDLTRAVHYYSLAAEQGHDDAQYALGSCYAKGKGIAQNMQLAVYWYQRAVEKNNDKAGTALGICYENGQGGLQSDMVQAVSLYRMSAEKNNYIAKYRLGLCYEQGKGVPFDPETAYKWFLDSALAGNTIAQYKVAECLMAGQGTAQNVAEAIEWYKKAAAGKSADACMRLSFYYAHGYGVEQNTQLSEEWARKAEEYGIRKKQRKRV